MMPEFGIDPVSIDVGHLVRRNVASLYSSLVTRPTGQAVRLAIENVLAEETGHLSLSVVDMSQVTIIDFSCADEVVAKLLLRYLKPERPRDALFVFRGIKELHRDPIEVVLKRHGLVAVTETEPHRFHLLGDVSPEESEAFRVLEDRGEIGEEDTDGILAQGNGRAMLNRLVDRRVAFKVAEGGAFHSLSALLDKVAGPDTSS